MAQADTEGRGCCQRPSWRQHSGRRHHWPGQFLGQRPLSVAAASPAGKPVAAYCSRRPARPLGARRLPCQSGPWRAGPRACGGCAARVGLPWPVDSAGPLAPRSHCAPGAGSLCSCVAGCCCRAGGSQETASPPRGPLEPDSCFSGLSVYLSALKWIERKICEILTWLLKNISEL